MKRNNNEKFRDEVKHWYGDICANCGSSESIEYEYPGRIEASELEE